MTMRQRPLSASLRHLLYGGAVLLLCAPLPALADQAATTPPPGRAAKADANQVKQLGAITVTAQSRSQEMQDVPIALQIVTAKQVDTLAATDLSKMDIFVPGLVVDGSQPTQPSYQLRGIGGSGFGIGTDPAVGVYVDGVYAAHTGGALMAFNDIQRIEVLKGPQGTLFGRNAAAGAISIVTNKPSDHFEAKARLRFGNYGKRYGDALVNIPLNDRMALRVSVMDNQSNGWLKDAATGKHYGKDDDWGTRAVWRWDVTPDTQVLLSWDHEKLNQPPRPAIGLVAMSNDPQQRAPFPPDPSTYLNPLHAPLYNDTVDAGETRRFDGSTLTIDHSFAWGSLTSTTAWRNFDTFNREDTDGTNHIVDYLDTVNIEHSNSWYQEFKLAGNTDLIDWVGGVSFYNEQARQTSQVNVFTDSVDTLAMNVGGAAPTDTFAYYDALLQQLGAPWNQYHLLGDPWREQVSNDGNFKAYAAYGDVIWHLTDRLNLTTGMRFTRDEKDFTWFNPPRQAPQLDAAIDGLMPLLTAFGIDPSAFQQNLVFNAGSGAPVGVLVKSRSSWNDFSPRAVLDYKFTPDVMGYVSVAKGYKAGGFNMLEFDSHYAPEKVWNYEAGIKTVFPEQRLLLNGSVYYYRYSNLQALTLDPNTSGSGVPRYVTSSSDQEAKGAELELQWLPTDALALGLNAAYIDSTYRKFVAPSGASLNGQPTGVPKYSYSAHLAYTWHDVAGGAVVFDLSQAYRGKSRCNSDSQLQGTCQVSPDFTVGAAQQSTDARLGWSSAGDHWGVALFATNLFNKQYVTGVGNTTESVFGTPYAGITPPRMWGLELNAKF